MRTLTRITIGVLLLSQAAFSNGGSQVNSRGQELRGDWRLGNPVTFRNLTLFPVIADKTIAANQFITLDEGLRSGKVVISEIGANGRARRIRSGDEPGDEAEVNTLLVTNRSGKTLLLIAGEVVIGGKQDRVVGHDCLIGSTNRPAPIDVFCVEQGRWSEDRAVGHSQSIARQRDQRAQRGRPRTGSTVMVGGTAGGVSGGVSSGVSGTFSMSAGIVAPPSLREEIQAKKDQTAVWNEVSKVERANNATSSTNALNAVFEDKEVGAKVEQYEQSLLKEFRQVGVVGVVVAISGEVVAADVFASARLFRAYWLKLLKSYSLQAMNSTEVPAQVPDADAARAFLSRSEGVRASDTRRAYRLIEHQSDADASFELSNRTNRAGQTSELIHFNRVKKH